MAKVAITERQIRYTISDISEEEMRVVAALLGASRGAVTYDLYGRVIEALTGEECGMPSNVHDYVQATPSPDTDTIVRLWEDEDAF